MAREARDRFVIAQFSDLHCGGPRFDEHLLEGVIAQINAIEPDMVVVPADGYRDEFETARAHLAKLDTKKLVVIPGNHDSRNVGYLHFAELFGERWCRHDVKSTLHTASGGPLSIRVVSVDSSKPDLNDGEVGRDRYGWIADQLGESEEGVFKIAVIHHHLVGIPNTGRERNVVLDAGDVLEVFSAHDVDLVLAGHKHVPYVWPVGGMLVCTSGTVSTWRTRANIPPSYNVICIGAETITVDIIDSNGEGRQA